MKNVLQRLAKSVLVPLKLTATVSASDTGIPKKMFASETTTLIISNEKNEDRKMAKGPFITYVHREWKGES